MQVCQNGVDLLLLFLNELIFKHFLSFSDRFQHGINRYDLHQRKLIRFSIFKSVKESRRHNLRTTALRVPRMHWA